PGVLDSEGYAVCPNCGIRLHCGKVGLPNLTEKHMGSDKCMKNRMKRDKGMEMKKNGSLLTFFMKPKASPVPSTVTGPSLVDKITVPVNTSPPPPSEAMTYPEPYNPKPHFIERFINAIAGLPESVPKATVYDSLAVFAGNPADYDDLSMNGNELWENILNKLLKSVFRWGEELDMEIFIRSGRYDLDGLVNFMRHFVIKQQVDEALFAGKLMHLLDRINDT
ncbi:hypothetical protein BDQ17DRAFT_1242238, partial [Cyathus striatus]